MEARLRTSWKKVFQALLFGLATLAPQTSARAQAWAYIEPEYGPRFYFGDEDTRRARAHFVNGDFGLAEKYFRLAAQSSPQNGAAWVGLAACYDRLGRFDLSERAYKRATLLMGANAVILNNHGYSYMLRGRADEAQRLLYRALQMAPDNPTIANNIAVLNSGQGYFWGTGSYIWGDVRY
jgi:Tfp pilus assembly protein PilF